MEFALCEQTIPNSQQWGLMEGEGVGRKDTDGADEGSADGAVEDGAPLG